MRTKRPGAVVKERLTVYLPVWMVRKLQQTTNQSVFIEECINKCTDWQEASTEQAAQNEQPA